MSGHAAYDRAGAEALVDGMVASGARVSLGFAMGLKKIASGASFRFMAVQQRGSGRIELMEVVVYRPSVDEVDLLQAMGFALHSEKRSVAYRGKMVLGDESWIFEG